MQSERTGIENKWYALKGRVVELKVEEDGDLHIALHDVTGDEPGSSSVKYLQNRSGARFAQAFLVGLPHAFLFTLALRRRLTFAQSPIITVIGKAYWDVGHAPKDQSNRRKYMPDYALRGVYEESFPSCLTDRLSLQHSYLSLTGSPTPDENPNEKQLSSHRKCEQEIISASEARLSRFRRSRGSHSGRCRFACRFGGGPRAPECPKQQIADSES
jgi:hypothetical protein